LQFSLFAFIETPPSHDREDVELIVVGSICNLLKPPTVEHELVALTNRSMSGSLVAVGVTGSTDRGRSRSHQALLDV